MLEGEHLAGDVLQLLEDSLALCMLELVEEKSFEANCTVVCAAIDGGEQRFQRSMVAGSEVTMNDWVSGFHCMARMALNQVLIGECISALQRGD